MGGRASQTELAPLKAWIVDTGPLVAYLDASDPAHDRVCTRWDDFSGRLVTSSAVITEAMHLVGSSGAGPRLLAELAAASALESYDLTRPPELLEAANLMERYSETPMDFADAKIGRAHV